MIWRIDGDNKIRKVGDPAVQAGAVIHRITI